VSERVYEGGKPAAHEPKVYPWMERAAEDLCPISEVTPLYIRAEIQDRQADVAEIIAKHASEPQPIRRGDVVQAVKNYETNEGNQIAKGDCFTALQVSPYGDVTISGLLSRIPGYVVARIGRARYYPDGTPVEA